MPTKIYNMRGTAMCNVPFVVVRKQQIVSRPGWHGQCVGQQGMRMIMSGNYRHAGSVVALAAMLAVGNGAKAGNFTSEVQGLMQDHPQIAAAAAAVRAGKQGERREFSVMLPQVTLRAAAGYELTDSAATSAAGLENERLFANNATLEVRQKLFDGMATYAGVASAKALTKASEHTLTATTQNVILGAVTSYLNVMRSRELVRLNQGNERAIQEQLNLEDERVQRGAGISVDVLQAKSRLQIARERSVAFEGALKNSVANYTQVFGHAPQVSEMEVVAAPLTLLPAEKEEAISSVRTSNPVIRIAEAQAQSAAQERRRLYGGYFPTVDLVGSANVENNIGGVQGPRQDYAIKVELTWALFDGLGTTSSTAEAAARHKQAQETGRDVSRRAVELLETSWHDREVASERATLLENAMSIAAEVYQARKEQREAGKETALNVLDAENELYNACINYVNAYYDAQIASYQVLNALGRLDQKAIAATGPVDKRVTVEGRCGFSASDGGYRTN